MCFTHVDKTFFGFLTGKFFENNRNKSEKGERIKKKKRPRMTGLVRRAIVSPSFVQTLLAGLKTKGFRVEIVKTTKAEIIKIKLKDSSPSL